MKLPVNFRLSKEANTILISLTQQLHLSKTEILERALYRYAETHSKTTHQLLKYAGCIGEDSADEMLTSIKTSKYNKKLNVKL